MTLAMMADSGAMCSLLNYETVKQMGLDPEKLEKSAVSITGVDGKRLQSQTCQMHVRIVNSKTKAESWEKVYVSPDVKVSLLSKDCLIRLKVLDPSQFLSDSELKSFSINTVDERKDKLSDCEKTFFTMDDGTIGCKCPRRTSPKPFNKSAFDRAFYIISTKQGGLADNCANFLKLKFKNSAMNICQTQPLSMMNVDKMKVEFKEGSNGMKAKRTSRVIPVPLAMREQTKKDLDSAVKMGILEDVSGQANQLLSLKRITPLGG